MNVLLIRPDSVMIQLLQHTPGDGWNDPAEPGDSALTLSLIRDHDNQLHLFYIDTEHRLNHRQQILPAKSWSPASMLADDAVKAAAGLNLDGRLEVFFSDKSSRLFHKWQDTMSGSWSQASVFGGTADQIAAARNEDGRLEVFSIDTNQVLRHNWQTAPNSGWDQGAVFVEQAFNVTTGCNPDGRIEVFYTGNNHLLFHRWQLAPNSAWSEPVQFGWSASDIATQVNPDGRLEVFYPDADGILFHNWQTEPGMHWAGEYPFQGTADVFFHVNEISQIPIYTTSHQNWHVNDHCFIRGKDGQWHMFGIVWPDPDSGDPMRPDYFGHAVASELTQPAWIEAEPPFHEPADNGSVLWAPHVILHNDTYYMFYCGGGALERYRILLRTSADLISWSDPVLLFEDGFQARDPMVRWCDEEKRWTMYYTATEDPGGGYFVVACRTSTDLFHWSARGIAYRDYHTGQTYGPTESPFVIQRGDMYYLFIGPRPHDYPTETLPDWEHPGYDGTDVFRSDRWDRWENAGYAGHIPVHAAEIVRAVNGDWYISRAGIKRGGLYLTKMIWLDGLDSGIQEEVSEKRSGWPDFILKQNRPNPFNTGTELYFSLLKPGHVRLEIIDTKGRIVKILADERFMAGDHRITWNGSGSDENTLPSGLYISRMRTQDRVEIRKLMMLK
ncbi:family 43 glycosylhydrolase [bacterium]|nr:family 43 glycosylhydrolase [bacterium]